MKEKLVRVRASIGVSLDFPTRFELALGLGKGLGFSWL